MKENLLIEEERGQQLNLDQFSFKKSRELLKHYKGSLSDEIIAERRIEQEYYDCQEVGADVLAGLQAVKEGKVDHRHWKKVLNEL